MTTETSHEHTTRVPESVSHPAHETPAAGNAMWLVALRLVLTGLGAGLIIVGSFGEWIGSAAGDQLSWRAFLAPDFDPVQPILILSAAGITIGIGILAILGLAFQSGWIARLAGALGLVAFTLFAIEVYRSNQDLADVRLGMWLILAGSVITLIGGFTTVTSKTANDRRVVVVDEDV